MATFQKFEEIDAWQQARVLTREIYAISNSAGFRKDFSLVDQIRRASVSIMSNIAEGFERSGTGEFTQFLAIAKGSAGEVQSHLYVAFDQGYIDNSAFERLHELTAQVGRMVNGLMSYLRASKIKGLKYK
jgi:four helix bundle protein